MHQKGYFLILDTNISEEPINQDILNAFEIITKVGGKIAISQKK